MAKKNNKTFLSDVFYIFIFIFVFCLLSYEYSRLLTVIIFSIIAFLLAFFDHKIAYFKLPIKKFYIFRCVSFFIIICLFVYSVAGFYNEKFNIPIMFSVLFIVALNNFLGMKWVSVFYFVFFSFVCFIFLVLLFGDYAAEYFVVSCWLTFVFIFVRNRGFYKIKKFKLF